MREWALHVASVAFVLSYLAAAVLLFDVCRYISACVAVRLGSWAYREGGSVRNTYCLPPAAVVTSGQVKGSLSERHSLCASVPRANLCSCL